MPPLLRNYSMDIYLHVLSVRVPHSINAINGCVRNIRFSISTIMIPRFQNPHLLFQQTETTCRAELDFVTPARPFEKLSLVDDGDLAWLENHITSNLQVATPERPKKRRRTAPDVADVDGSQASELKKCRT